MAAKSLFFVGMGAIDVVPSHPILCSSLHSCFGLVSSYCWDGRSMGVTHLVNIVLCWLGWDEIKKACWGFYFVVNLKYLGVTAFLALMINFVFSLKRLL